MRRSTQRQERLMPDILNLNGFEVIEVQQNDYDYLIDIETTRRPTICERCGTVNATLHVHSHHKQVWKDVPHHGKRTRLRWDRVRYNCQECVQTFMEAPPPGTMDDKRRMTERLVKYIARQSLTETFTKVGEDTGADEKTIRNVFDETIRNLEMLRVVPTPKWLGIDEIYLFDKPRAVFADLENDEVLDMLPTRRKRAVVNFFRTHFNPDKVEVVTIDMWRQYRSACREVLPQADVVVDKFHVMLKAVESMDGIRKAVGRELEPGDKRRLTKERHLIHKHSSQLTDQERLMVDGLLSLSKRLRRAYELKEEFYTFYQSETREEAEERLRKWESRVEGKMEPAFAGLLSPLSGWREEILNYFDHRVTNAAMESLNNAIKTMHRIGRGYSFEVMRARIVHGHPREQRPRFGEGFHFMQAHGIPYSTLTKMAEHDESNR